MNETAILSQLNAELTRLIKAEIVRQDLVDTGLMRDSTLVESRISAGEIVIDILSTDYFEYVDKNFNVMDNVTRTYQWNKAIEDAIGKIFEAQIN